MAGAAGARIRLNSPRVVCGSASRSAAFCPARDSDQPFGLKPGVGQVPSSRTAGLVVIPPGEMEAANLRIAAHRSELQSGTSIRRPSGGWL